MSVGGSAGLTALGAVDSLPVGLEAPPVDAPPEDGAGQGVETGPRFYDYGPGSLFGASAALTRDGRALVLFVYEGHQLYTLDGVRANHLLQQVRVDLLAPLHGPLGIGATGEYFDRRTYYQDAAGTEKRFHFPQFRVFLTWRVP